MPATMTTRQHAVTNTRGIDRFAVIAVRAIIRKAMFCKRESEASREPFAITWYVRYRAYLQAAKIICDVYA